MPGPKIGDNAKKAIKGAGIAGGITSAAAAVEMGLGKAAKMAGGVLRSIFGFLPWDSPQEVAGAVSDGAGFLIGGVF